MGSTVAYVRRGRLVPPVPPGGELELVGPPEVARAVPQNLLVRLLPVVMVVALVGMVALMLMTGGRGALSNPLFLMFPLMMVMSMVGMLASGGRGGPARAAEVNEDRKDYLRYLAQTRARIADTVRDQRACALWSHPDPAALPALLGTVRMWERRSGDADFVQVRLGIGTQPLATALVPPEVGPAEELEPVCALALRRFVQAHATVSELPTAVSLRSFPAVGVEGPRDVARSMLAQLAVLHAPDQLLIAIVTDDPAAPDWDWAKWLPHIGHPAVNDRLGPVRMIYDGLEFLETELAADLADRGRFSRSAPPVTARPHLLVVLDGGRRTGDEELAIGAGREGLTVLDLQPDTESLAVRRGLQLVVGPDQIAARSVAGLERFAAIDQLSAARAEGLARSLARYRLASSLPLPGLDTSQVATDPGLPALLGIGDAGAFDPDTRWRGRSPQDRLRVPIGYTSDGTPVDLDLKESAHGGMGPHGLCIGATGSGKSEFLRTLVLALIATHSPDELNLVLVDFKGGATFLGLHSRHVAALITNLEQELTMVDRMADALSGELNRRQELLRSAGNFANVGEYEQARQAGAPLAPLPALFIVVDEFSELLAQKPEFAELFVAIGRLGRSLHIHLLLASQRLDEGRLRGLDSHLSYRIGLKTFSANESRTVLGVPDAYHLPSTPGAAYLKCDSAAPVRFSTSFVSGPYHPPRGDGAGQLGGPIAPAEVLRFTAQRVPLPVAERGDDEEQTSAGATGSLLETLVGRITGHGTAPHPVWLPPLEPAVTLDAFLDDQTETGTLRIPLGVVDRPYEQRRETLWLDLSGAAGNAAIVGGPQSGKSTAVRTLICAAAATHTPQQAAFYCLDFGGGTLTALSGLPHVAGVATKNRRDAVRRTLAEVKTILTAREEFFAAEGLESMREYRAARRAGRYIDQPYGDVFLVIDGLTTLRSDFEDQEDEVNLLVTQGLSYGVHVVVASARWADVRPAMKDLLGTRLELRLGDPLDSEMSRKVAATVPTGRPGRGLTADELHLLVALPRTDGVADTDSLPAGTAAFVAATAAEYPDRFAPRLRLLDDDVSLEDIAELLAAQNDPPRAGQATLGLRESDLQPATLDFDGEPHLLIFGDAESGKTQALRTLITGLLASGSSEDCKVVLVDYRRMLLGLVDGDHLAGYASSAQSASPMMTQLAEYLTARLPAEDVGAEELTRGDWWTGPTVYLVVDDYDLVATAMGNPLQPLLELLGHARDIGLRVILARRSGGIGRALFDPVIARLRDLSCDVLLLSGDADEGYIVGRHRMQKLIPGRGELISRTRGADMVQVAR